MTNQETFQLALETAYRELFSTDPEYAYSASRITPEALAAKMTAGLATGGAKHDGTGIKRACKAVGIAHTVKAIRAYLKD
jgi:hypothetical protein